MSAPAPPANLNPNAQAAADASNSGASLPIEYSSFHPPLPEGVLPTWSIVIEFCDRCRWVHRATWTQTELFVTFGEKGPTAATDGGSSSSSSSSTATVKSITLIPMTKEETAGRFRVWLYGNKQDATSTESKAVCVYDRKVKGGFPELKELKQLIRDVISPSASLGHSDRKTRDVSGTGHEPPTGTATTD